MGNTLNGKLGTYECHGAGGNQDFTYLKSKLLKHQNLCLSVSDPPKMNENVLLKKCPEGDIEKMDQYPRHQMWDIKAQRIRLVGTSFCLKADHSEEVTIVDCKDYAGDKNHLAWYFTNSGSLTAK